MATEAPSKKEFIEARLRDNLEASFETLNSEYQRKYGDTLTGSQFYRLRSLIRAEQSNGQHEPEDDGGLPAEDPKEVVPAHAPVHPDIPAAPKNDEVIDGGEISLDPLIQATGFSTPAPLSPAASVRRAAYTQHIGRVIRSGHAHPAGGPLELATVEELLDEVIFKMRTEADKRTPGVTWTIIGKVRDVRREWMAAMIEADRWEP